VPVEAILMEDGLAVSVEPVDLEASFRTSRRGVDLHATLRTRITLICVRCLARFEQPISREFHLTFVRSSGDDATRVDPQDDPEEAGGTRDADLYHLAGDTVDLADVVREQVDLDLPMKPVCRDDCRGLCAQCGADLNKGSCRCPEAPSDPRWAALADWKKRKKTP
jgi:uncharacterized protein